MVSCSSRRGALAALGLFSALLGACGGGANAGAQGQAVVQFPGRDALQAIAAKPVSKPSLPKTAQIIDTWTIEMAPPPDKTQEAWSPTGSWETLFAEVAEKAPQKPRMTLAMACVARELGRFFMANKAAPDDGLRRFMIGGCGNLVHDVDARYFTMEVPTEVKDEEFFKKSSPSFGTQIASSLAHRPDSAGFWFGRKDKDVVAFVVSAREQATIKPFSLTPDARGEVLIEGRTLQPTQYFHAYVNRGATSASTCEIDMSVPRPDFRIICRIDPKDETAWVQILSVPPKRALGSVFAQALVRRSPDAPPKYEAIRYGDPAPVKAPAEFTASVLQNLNRVRKEAGMSELTLAKAESQSAAMVAPHYFSSMFDPKGDVTQVDTIALGLLAGWDVQGMIRDAHLVSTTATTLDASRWLTSALEMPIGRNTLFDPNIEQVAFGPMIMPDEGVIGAISVGYRFHHGTDHTDDENYLLSRVVQARTRMKLTPPARLGGVEAILNEELTRVHEGKASPTDVMSAALQRAVELTQRGMRGYVMQTSSLEELQLPEDALRQPTLHLDIGVTHFKPEDGAWAQYAILVVYATDS